MTYNGHVVSSMDLADLLLDQQTTAVADRHDRPAEAENEDRLLTAMWPPTNFSWARRERNRPMVTAFPLVAPESRRDLGMIFDNATQEFVSELLDRFAEQDMRDAKVLEALKDAILRRDVIEVVRHAERYFELDGYIAAGTIEKYVRLDARLRSASASMMRP